MANTDLETFARYKTGKNYPRIIRRALQDWKQFGPDVAMSRYIQRNAWHRNRADVWLLTNRPDLAARWGQGLQSWRFFLLISELISEEAHREIFRGLGDNHI